ncbi:hypothetical protein GGS26DRAFT_310451 [Hypomontagnella submonticulosa]|nr:hypothetical protein GGS26DRAFT_310451 [Hypomontagnella submonticulosa]
MQAFLGSHIGGDKAAIIVNHYVCFAADPDKTAFQFWKFLLAIIRESSSDHRQLVNLLVSIRKLPRIGHAGQENIPVLKGYANIVGSSELGGNLDKFWVYSVVLGPVSCSIPTILVERDLENCANNLAASDPFREDICQTDVEKAEIAKWMRLNTSAARAVSDGKFYDLGNMIRRVFNKIAGARYGVTPSKLVKAYITSAAVWFKVAGYPLFNYHTIFRPGVVDRKNVSRPRLVDWKKALLEVFDDNGFDLTTREAAAALASEIKSMLC